MARPAFTLAALATAAVPGLEVATARVRTTGQSGDFDAAEILSTDGQHLIIRVPRTQAAERDQSADLVALRALTDGARQRLPFAVPSYLGQAPVGPTRGILYGFIPGAQLTGDAITGDPTLAASAGRAIAAIHSVPTSLVTEAGLPSLSASQERADAVALVAEAARTGNLPVALQRRWEEATDDDALWQFAPTVINGELAPDSFLVLDNQVNGVLGWASLSVGDPARDIHWLLSARGSFAELAMSSYIAARGGSVDPLLARRALLYGELELARWLLHGTTSKDAAVIDDAVALLDALVASVHSDAAPSISNETGPILTVTEVETILDQTPSVASVTPSVSLMTDSYDRSEFERAAAGESATESLGSGSFNSGSYGQGSFGEESDSATEPAAIDRSVFEGAPRWEPTHPDQVSTEPLSLPSDDSADDQSDTNSSSL